MDEIPWNEYWFYARAYMDKAESLLQDGDLRGAGWNACDAALFAFQALLVAQGERRRGLEAVQDGVRGLVASARCSTAVGSDFAWLVRRRFEGSAYSDEQAESALRKAEHIIETIQTLLPDGEA